MKQLTLFFIYAIGRDYLDFWTRMDYDKAHEQVNLAYADYRKKFKHTKDKELLYDAVKYYLMNHLPDHIKI